MWNGKKKAITFSFDDGVWQDRPLIAILNKYGLKGTFNLNSDCFGSTNSYEAFGKMVCRDRLKEDEAKTVYAGHEVAVHTLTHPNLTQQTDEEVIRQVEGDRKNLERIFGYPVVGMAYPCGGVNNDDRVAAVIRKNSPIQYARTITTTHSFELQKDSLLRFNATAHFLDKELNRIADEFLALDPEREQLLYIWGHSYELDAHDAWNWFDAFCQKIAGKADIFYGTNREVLL
jgi:peptidoglycan/xylan/chitin deacetylase (PgdA/CDA1 family)